MCNRIYSTLMIYFFLIYSNGANCLIVSENLTVDHLVNNNKYIIAGSIIETESIFQKCKNVAFTKYYIDSKISSDISLENRILEVIAFGGKNSDGHQIYANKNLLLNKNQDVVLFLNETSEEELFVSDLTYGALHISNDKVFTPWFNNNALNVHLAVEQFKTKQQLITSFIPLKESIVEYYKNAWKGEVGCENQLLEIKDGNLKTNYQFVQSQNDSKFSIIFPGRTSRKSITGPAEGSSLAYILTNSIFNSWNRYGNDDDLINFYPGNNQWGWGGIVPKNEFGGFPSDADLISQGLPPWGSSWAITFLRTWGDYYEADILVNPNYEWTTSDWIAAKKGNQLKYLYNTMGHELGHFLNLDHPFEHYDVNHHSIMNYSPSHSRRDIVGVDDLKAFSGSTSLISPPFQLSQNQYNIIPMAVYDNLSSNHAGYDALNFFPKIFDCLETDCTLDKPFSASIFGFTFQNLGMLVQTEPINLGFMSNPQGSTFSILNGDNSPLANIQIPQVNSLSDFSVSFENAIDIDFGIPASGRPIYSTADIRFSGGLLWPFLSRSADYSYPYFSEPYFHYNKPSINSIFIKGLVNSEVYNTEFNGFNFEDVSFEPMWVSLPYGGAQLFNAKPNQNSDLYLKLKVSSNIEIHIREIRLDLNNYSREFRLCGGSQFEDLRIQLDPFDGNNYSRFLVFYKEHDEVYFHHSNTNLGGLSLQYYQGSANGLANYHEPIAISYDTIFKSSYENHDIVSSLDCDMNYEPINQRFNTFTMFELGMPQNEFMFVEQ